MDKVNIHITEMEYIYEEILQEQGLLEKSIKNYNRLQPKIEKLEKYYTSPQWKKDFASDERGEIPSDIKRGILSEDGIYNMLERNKEIMEMIGVYEEKESFESNSAVSYHDVVRRAQDFAKKRGVYGNDKVELYPCDTWLNGDQINLWTYWQGYQYKDVDEGVDILLVGQDWGSPEKDEETIKRIQLIQSGKTDSFYNDHTSITDENLKKLFKCFNCDIEKADPGLRLFFTNYSLGYRKGREQRGMTKKLLLEDSSFFDDLIKAIKPKIIICLGKITYEVVSGQTAKGFTEQLRNGMPFVSTYPNMNNIKVYGVAHCGALGSNNVGGMANMIKAWKAIAKEFRGKK